MRTLLLGLLIGVPGWVVAGLVFWVTLPRKRDAGSIDEDPTAALRESGLL